MEKPMTIAEVNELNQHLKMHMQNHSLRYRHLAIVERASRLDYRVPSRHIKRKPLPERLVEVALRRHPVFKGFESIATLA